MIFIIGFQNDNDGNGYHNFFISFIACPNVSKSNGFNRTLFAPELRKKSMSDGSPVDFFK